MAMLTLKEQLQIYFLEGMSFWV